MQSMKCAAVSAAVTVSLTEMRCTISVNRSTKTNTLVRPSASGGSPKMKSVAGLHIRLTSP
ncbi:hypothetical protein PF005_g29500 [Phytophthora fragariae]|uniref:Uncharacterized protein n=2 Tax=Phytophthora TaxID=4783 RepID=A0A6A3Q4U1_9STRA|nr:hypothetical protein PF009_g30224 [Phytophthora fragariae]KAE8963197.1 hypothetical protein PR001_g29451 [Phytophthora rubi]KAE8962480.1 hypothetical protein PF011_g29374 [Phytophthora fragariae]KAE9057226.1 hypothetical protein PF007_g31717 [Phytophthora fragariae]KAE9064461.1 hypothetical protein PF010_g28599 [Phytophthora fragariae]